MVLDALLEAILEVVLQRANAAPPPQQQLVQPPAWARREPITKECVAKAIREQGVSGYALAGIMRTEDGRVGGLVRSPDGSYDLGPMGINTVHLKELSAQLGKSPSEMAYLLIYDGCFNVAVAAWHLRNRTNEAGGDFWQGVGRYHSRTQSKAAMYIPRVNTHLRDLLQTAQRASTESRG